MKRQSRAPAPRGSPCRGNGTAAYYAEVAEDRSTATAAGAMGPDDPARFSQTIEAKLGGDD
ncbi:MAG: hypothetical protein WBP40_02595 [Candidatus Moraniibacteriota bacterium]